jgi:exopolysaccharide biosynthesis polyprenyl glycosylphosphotransferase
LIEERSTHAGTSGGVSVHPPGLATLGEKASAGAMLRERRYRRLLATADALAAVVAVVVAFGLPGGVESRWTFLLLAPFLILGAKLLGLYDRDELIVRKTTLDDVPRLAALSMAAVLAVWAFGDALVPETLTRESDMAMGAVLFVSLLLGRSGARRLARVVTPPERCLLIGPPETQTRLARIFDDEPGVMLVSSLSLPEAHGLLRADANPLLVRQLIAGEDIHRAILEPEGGAHTEMTLDVLRGAKAHGLRISVLPSVFDVIGTSVKLDDVGGVTLLGIHRFGLSRSSAFVKRGFDLIVGGVTLVVGAPLLALTALAIKIDSPGPVLFRQTRVGRYGRHFRIYKFRTMSLDAEARKSELEQHNEATGLFKIAADPRITRVGRFLRRTSLDELPQLINVMRGEMSLVGPRPLIPPEDRQIVGWDRRRLTLTPGMTGPWQIAGSARVPLNEMVRFDYRYAATWSMWSDIKILLRTVQYVVAQRGM